MKGVDVLVRGQHDNQNRAILDWLSTTDYAKQQNDFIREREPGTGQWFLDSAEFQEWLAAAEKTLFCAGIPGAGKTILSATVINHLQETAYGDPTIALACIYCNYQRRSEQKLESILSSLLMQLVRSQSSLPECITNLFEKHQASRTLLSVSEIASSLRSVAEVHSKVFVVVDALDECEDVTRDRMLDVLFDLQGGCNVNIFATSRIHDNISRRFEGCLTRNVYAAGGDVSAYVDTQMGLLDDDILDDDLRASIQNDVSHAAEGM